MAVYALLPLIWLPAGVAAYEALAPVRRCAMRLAFQRAAPPEQAVLAAVFDGLNTYLGKYIGEFLGELCFSLFFLLTSIVWLQSLRPTRWIGWLGLVTAASGLVGMFRNVMGPLAPIAALNNYLLPVFMIVLGIALARWCDVSPQPAGE